MKTVNSCVCIVKRRRRSILTANAIFILYLIPPSHAHRLCLLRMSRVVTYSVNYTDQLIQGAYSGFQLVLYASSFTVTAEGEATVTSSIPPPRSASYVLPSTATLSRATRFGEQHNGVFLAGPKSKWLMQKRHLSTHMTTNAIPT